MHLIADRFAVDDRGFAIDLATTERVQLITSVVGGPSEQTRWAERCAWLSRAAHPSLSPLVDYGVIGETQRFEAWAVQSGWHGAPSAAATARMHVVRFLEGNGRSPVANNELQIGSRHGRPCIVPDAVAGLPVSEGAASGATHDRACLGVVRAPDRRLHPVAELFSGVDASRVVAVSVWIPAVDDAIDAVRELARAARLVGLVPLSTQLFDSAVRPLVKNRTLVLFATGQPETGWRSIVEAALDSAKPHIVVFIGPHAVRRVHAVSPQRWSTEALIASAGPPAVAKHHVRAISTAARRACGVRERFERCLFGDALRSHAVKAAGGAGRQFLDAQRRPLSTLPVQTHERVAEAAVAYVAHGSGVQPEGSVGAAIRAWPAPGELLRLAKHVESGRMLLRAGRHQPGERIVRQAMHALARRGEWVPASEAALALVHSLVNRGCLPEAATVADDARGWLSRARDLRLLEQFALVTAHLQIERGRLVDAESILETALEAALSSANGVGVDATLGLVRCLYWQGRYADAWNRLAVMPIDGEPNPRDRARLWTARARVAIGRGRIAEAVATAAHARDEAVALGDARLCAEAWYASALAQCAAGDSVQADVAASRAVLAARSGHHPLLAICARILRAEIARHRGQRGPAALLVKRLSSISSKLPLTVRARLGLLADSLPGVDVESVAQRCADTSRLPALRLFGTPTQPSIPSPSADDIVGLLQCCQIADDDGVVLTAVCARLRVRLGAAGVSFFASERDEVACVACDGTRVEPSSAVRVKTANALVLPHRGGERAEAGVPVRYAGQVVGWLVAVWSLAGTWQDGEVTLLLSTGSTAAAPALVGLMARRVSQRATRGSELRGVSQAIEAVRIAVEKAAAAPFAVLVEGESGSGKELVARLLHKQGPRRDRPFITLNCAALPDDLVESELFGHARGAFTGAVGERRGVFEEAHSGTLFLDEIGELSARAQAKLLRVIQEGEIRRVGENTCRRVDVRLITATNRDLRAEAASGRFRLDLLYRLDVVRIALPALRERPDDIAVLAEHFWREATERVGSRATLSAGTVAALTRHAWPGNIRELQNVLASLAVRVPRRGSVPASALPTQFGAPLVSGSFRLDSARRVFDRSFVRAALVRTGGHRSQAAEELGVSRQGLAKLMARLDIEDEGESGACERPARGGGVSRLEGAG